MRMRTLSVLVALVLAMPLAAQDTYVIDAVHSEVGFKVRHLGLSKVSGRFTQFAGTIVVNGADMTKSSVDVTIQAASVNTDNEGRDKHLRAPDFFDVAKFPTVTFKSKVVKEVTKGKLEVTGDFTLHGVTRPITIPVTVVGIIQTPFKDTRGAFEGALTLKRSDFGMGGFVGVVGDDIDISLAVEAVKVEKK